MSRGWPKIKPLLIGLVGIVVLLLLACTPDHPQSTFDVAGPVADKQRTLFYIIFWAAIFVFVVVEGALIYAVFRFRWKPGQNEMPPQVHGHTALEIGWTIFPVVIIAVIAVPTIIYIFDIAEDPPADEAIEINVIGHQWWWEFEYPEQSVVTANEMHVPVDTPVKLNLMSDDVIHSFWIPKLAGKQDVVPNNVNPLQFTANFVGTYFGQCAEFCGVAHAHMRFRVIVESQFEFDKWVTAYHTPLGPLTGEAAQGATQFAVRGCLLCHKADGPAPKEIRQALRESFEGGELRFPAPNLTNFGSRTTMAAGMMELNEENLVKWLRDPDEVKPGNRMAELATVYNDEAAKMSEEDISALAAYLLSLK